MPAPPLPAYMLDLGPCWHTARACSGGTRARSGDTRACSGRLPARSHIQYASNGGAGIRTLLAYDFPYPAIRLSGYPGSAKIVSGYPVSRCRHDKVRGLGCRMHGPPPRFGATACPGPCVEVCVFNTFLILLGMLCGFKLLKGPPHLCGSTSGISPVLPFGPPLWQPKSPLWRSRALLGAIQKSINFPLHS